MTPTQITYTAIGITAVIVIATGWFFFFRAAPSTSTNTPDTFFGTSADNTPSVAGNAATSENTQPSVETSGQTAQTKVFQISAGPVVGATFVQTLRPTTTLARYMRQEDGHVYDLPLDVPGAIPKVISNVTIPGGQRLVWVEGGNAAIMQYLDEGVVKTVYMGFPVATSSAVLPTRLVFLPDAIIDIAASPDGKSVAYLLKTGSGSDGYIAKSDGTSSKKLFSLPLSQMLISWPSTGFLLVQTASAAGVPGIALSVDAKTGASTPLVHAAGITATANQNFSKVIYQTSDGATVSSYLRDMTKGTNGPLSFNPYPERCIWGVATSTAYCAVPTNTVAPNYLDGWHLGVSSVSDSILKMDFAQVVTDVIAIPGINGGVRSDVASLSLSLDEKYLSFITKGDRALWGVRLSQ